MALTVFQEIVLKAMQRMKPAQQEAVARFTKSLTRERLATKTRKQKSSKRGVSVDNLDKTRKVQKQGKQNRLDGVAKPPKSSKNSRAPSKSRFGNVNLQSSDWLFSENRRRNSTPRSVEPSGQKWAQNRWNHRGS
jgi:hypothetical protein